MNALTLWLTALILSMLLSGAPVAAQTKTGCDPATTPAKVEGQVVKVDKAQNKITVRANDGTTHEFQASKDVVKDLKAGDRIEANLRSAPSGC
jgi:hypothetical protein